MSDGWWNQNSTHHSLERRLGEQQITRAPETESESESKTAADTTREHGSNRIANGSRPDSRKHINRYTRNITSPNTHTHIHNAGESGQAGRAGVGIVGRPVQGASRGRGPGKAGRSKMGCGMAGVAGQWQHAGMSANRGKTHAAWSAVRWRRGSLSAHKLCSHVARRMEDELMTSHDSIRRP
jgi:hypothetical protein